MRWWAVAWTLVAMAVTSGGVEAAISVERIDSVVRGQATDQVRLQLTLSAPARAQVRTVAATDGGTTRLYVDLPRGTRLARGVKPPRTARGPLRAVRAGIGDGNVLRLVLDVEGPVTCRVTRARGGRVLTLDLARAVTGPSASSPGGGGMAPTAPHAPRIVLDPGHGGQDPGARGYAVEKDVTLAISRELAALLRERHGVEVLLTRTRDETLSLAERTAIANRADADLFVSIHANSSPSRRLQGVETYYLNNTDDRATIRLAAMENGIDELTPRQGSSELRYILSDLVQVGKLEESAALAGAVHRALVRHLRTTYADVVDLGVKQGPFYVLVGAYMPCVLVETSFLNHRTEGRRLASRRYQRELAEGLAVGIGRFLESQRRARTL